jgi:arylsulfatase A-like enzyme
VASFVNPHDIAFAGGLYELLLGFEPSDDTVPAIPEPPSQRDSFAGRPGCQERFKQVWPQMIAEQPTDLAYRQLYYYLHKLVDQAIGRILDSLDASGMADDTIVVLTSDHGDQMGDHWLTEKLGWFEQSYHIPCIVRDPSAPESHGRAVDRFTENVDVMPTVLDWLALEVPLQCDGRSLLPLVRGDADAPWRDAAFWEWEFRDPIGGWAEKFLGITMDQCAISVLRDDHGKYVHFTGLPPLFYDLDADPDELVDRAADPAYAATVLGYAQRMLSHRMEHVDQTLTGLVVTAAGVLDGRR